MNCHLCGERFAQTVSDLPFRLGPTAIVIVKRMPVFECVSCGEFSLEDPVMRKVEILLQQTDQATELTVIPYASLVAV